MSLLSIDPNAASSHPHLSYTDALANAWQEFLVLVGRVLIGWIFVMYGWRKIFDIPSYAQTFPRRGLAEWMAWVAVPIELFVGLALLLGFATRYAAIIMFLFLIVATFSSHAYWSYPQAQQANQEAHFWKNIALMGGMILVFARGGGRFSLDTLLFRKNGGR
jgi:putative oxidoreductase